MSNFENESELKIFKTMNLIRLDPLWVIPHIKNIRHHKKYTGANINLVLNRLKVQSPLPMLEVSQLASKACKKVNE